MKYLSERDSAFRTLIAQVFSDVMRHKIFSTERGIDQPGSLKRQCRLQSREKAEIDPQGLQPVLELITADAAQCAGLRKAGAEGFGILE